MKQLLLIIIFSSTLNIAISQPVVFTIQGHVSNVDSGKIFLVPVVSNEKYYGENFHKDSAVIKNGVFEFNRKASDYNTYSYRLLIKSHDQNGITDFVFLNGNNVFIEIDTIDAYVSPKISTSLVQNEMKSEYNSFFKTFVERVSAFNEYEENIYLKFNNNLPKENIIELEATQKQLYKQSDSLFGIYAENHPTSQVTLWKMIERIENLGYISAYKNIFEKLPGELQKSFIGQSLFADMLGMEMLSNGSVFPDIRLENTDGEFLSFDKTILGKTLTLVDFWFTDCGPCRKQFPEFKRMFNAYKADGFQIISISIDGPSKLNVWKNLIKKEKLKWNQLLDKSGGVTQKLGINSFPTNFLLDSNGVILQKNITLTELETILIENNLKM